MSQEEARNSINSKLSEIASENEITGWHLPNEAEMDAVYSIGLPTINQKIQEPIMLYYDFYGFDDNGVVKGFLFNVKWILVLKSYTQTSFVCGLSLEGLLSKKITFALTPGL